MLLLVNLRQEMGPFTPLRLLYTTLVVSAGLLTFVPIQQALELPRLAWEGTLGTFLLFYTLAFVPPPTRWLLSLPDMPVYGLLIVALFETTSIITLPFLALLHQRRTRQRVHRIDVQQARRHSYEVGLLATGVVVLAGLRVLTWISALLLLLILVTMELLILSRKKT